MVEIIKKMDLIVTRLFDAPIEQVWKSWTDPEQVMRWWGPKDYTSPFCRIDLREGGKYVFGMRAPDYQGGQDSYSAGIYSKIVPHERLEFTMSLSDKDGNRVDPAKLGFPGDFPSEIPTTIVFRKARCDMTELTITEKNWVDGQIYVYSLAGMHQSMDKLTEILAKGRT